MAMQGVAMVAIGGAGLSKLLDLPAFARTLSTWSIVPRWGIGTLTAAIPISEMVLAGCWVVWPARKSIAWTAVVYMAVLTAAFFGEYYASAQPPKCGCFGAIMQRWQFRESAGFVTWRNAGIIALCGVGGALGPRKQGSVQADELASSPL